MRGTPTAEEWRDIPGYEGLYQVSDQGRVFSLGQIGRRARVLRPGIDKTYGHRRVSLCKDGEHRTFLVHALVLLAFVGPRPPDMEACHDPDRDPGNNRLSNLRWGTSADNSQDMINHGTVLRGERANGAKLTPAQVGQIRLKWQYGEAHAALAAQYGVSKSNISRIIAGRIWGHL